MKKVHHPIPLLLIFLGLFMACSQAPKNEASQNVNQSGKDSCDDPDAPGECNFIHMPEVLSSKMDLAYRAEGGQPIIIHGKMLKADGKTPYAGVIMYAYQTDHTGIYPKKGNEKGVHRWHGYLHGWCKSDATGHYEIHTIKPGMYPDHSQPAHIHAMIKEPGGKDPYYITDFFFAGDSAAIKHNLTTPEDKQAIISLQERDGLIYGRRDIILRGN